MDPLTLAEATPKFHIVPYNEPCLIFFAICGLAMQIPVLFVHSGLFSRPNIPVIIMSLCYVYTSLSITLNAFGFSSNDPAKYWSGKGWCDVDVRMQVAICLCILSTQCVINYNLLGMLTDRPRVARGRTAIIHGAVQIFACLLLPIVSLAVDTFTMRSRFMIFQDIGCANNMDSSAAFIIIYCMWLPILGLATLILMIVIMYKFYKRGKDKTFETVSFIPNMSAAQFVRIIVFSLAVTCIFAPLCIALSVVNFITIGEAGVSPIAWAHGKPANWDTILVVTLRQLEIEGTGTVKASLIISFITRYINIAIAWLLFFCYATGTLAVEAYVKTWRYICGKFGVYKVQTNDSESITSSYADSQAKSPIFVKNEDAVIKRWMNGELEDEKW